MRAFLRALLEIVRGVQVEAADVLAEVSAVAADVRAQFDAKEAVRKAEGEEAAKKLASTSGTDAAAGTDGDVEEARRFFLEHMRAKQVRTRWVACR